MTAPDLELNLNDGSSRTLKSFYETRPLALVFLRHLGCIFCRQHAAQLRAAPEMNVLFVAMGTRPEVQEFADELEVVHPIACDPDRRLYRLFGLADGHLYQMISPRVMLRAIAALKHGHRQFRPQSNPTQMAGAFAIDTDGEVVWEYRSTDISDNPTVKQIGARLYPHEKTAVAGGDEPGSVDGAAGG